MCNDISHTSIEAYVYNEEVNIKLFSFRFEKKTVIRLITTFIVNICICPHFNLIWL